MLLFLPHMRLHMMLIVFMSMMMSVPTFCRSCLRMLHATLITLQAHGLLACYLSLAMCRAQ